MKTILAEAVGIPFGQLSGVQAVGLRAVGVWAVGVWAVGVRAVDWQQC